MAHRPALELLYEAMDVLNDTPEQQSLRRDITGFFASRRMEGECDQPPLCRGEKPEPNSNTNSNTTDNVQCTDCGCDIWC